MDGSNEIEEEAYHDNANYEEDEVIDDDDPIENEPEQSETEEDKADTTEKKEPPRRKNRAQKRITGLVSELKQLRRDYDMLRSKESTRSKKETDDYNKSRYDDVLRRQKQAFDDSDSAKFTQANAELIQLSHSNQNQDPNFDTEGYFSNKFSWYNTDQKKTMIAQNIHQKILNDQSWNRKSMSDQLDEVGKRTNEMFKTNPYRKSSPSDGAPISRGSAPTTVTKTDLEIVRKMYPRYSRSELIKKARIFNERTDKLREEEERSYGIYSEEKAREASL